MNKPCHAIATAKHIPIYLRLRSNHSGNGPGNSVCKEDAATTRNMKGTAQRTEKPIIVDTPAPVDISASIMAMTITMDIGIEISQNNLHWLMALFFSTTFRSILIYSYHLLTQRT
jgi:hypothetical protein